MPKDKNINLVKDLREKVKNAKSILFVDYLGLNVNDVNLLRDKITQNNADSVVAKNTLIKIAMEEEKINTKDISSQLKGPTAAIFSYGDPISPVKTVIDFSKKMELPKVKFAYIDGRFITSQEVKLLSELPSKEQLLAQMLGSMKSPITKFVNILGGTQQRFVTVLSRISENKK